MAEVRTADLLYVEAAKLAVDVHKSAAALSIAFVAALGTYLKAAQISDIPGIVVLCFLFLLFSTLCSLFALLQGVTSMANGYSPLEFKLFRLSVIVSPLAFFVGAIAGMWVFLTVR